MIVLQQKQVYSQRVPQLPLVCVILAFIAKQVQLVLPSSLACQEHIEVSMVEPLAVTVVPVLLVAIAPLPVLLRFFVPAATIAPVVSRARTLPAWNLWQCCWLELDDECTACDPGYYCDTFALQAPSGLCSPGFYCLSGQNTSTPTNPYSSVNITSDVCPAGHYCPLGTVLPISCPEGTFNDDRGGTSSADRTSCTPGYYCAGTGNSHPTGECTAGYYCTGGATVPTQYQVSAGHYSLAAAVQEEACIQGYYQPNVGQSTCVDCPAGSFCPYTGMNNITNTPLYGR